MQTGVLHHDEQERHAPEDESDHEGVGLTPDRQQTGHDAGDAHRRHDEVDVGRPLAGYQWQERRVQRHDQHEQRGPSCERERHVHRARPHVRIGVDHESDE